MGSPKVSRVRGAAVGLVVLALVAFAIVRLVASNGTPEATRQPGFDDLVVPGAGVIRWSPDATKLAVLAGGEVVLVRVSDGKELGRAGGTITDAAWMPDATRVVVVEGPIPTGQVVAIEPTGRVAGTTKLNPSLAFGEGRGLAIDSRGRQAAAIATRRDAIGGATHADLALINLQTGATRVFVTDDLDEANPVFVDDGTIAFAATSRRGENRLHSMDLPTGVVRTHGRMYDGPFAALASGEVVVSSRAAQGAVRLDALDLDGGSRVLGVLRRHTRPVAVDRFGTRVLVRRYGGLGGTRLAIEVLAQ